MQLAPATAEEASSPKAQTHNQRQEAESKAMDAQGVATAPAIVEEVDGESEEEAPKKELSDQVIAAFRQFAEGVLEIVKQREELDGALPASLAEPEIQNSKLVSLLPVADSPLLLRVRFDPEEHTLDVGWVGKFDERLLGKYRRGGRKLKEELGVDFHVNDEEYRFAFFKQEEAKKNRPELENMEALARKIANIYNRVLKYSQVMSE